MKTLKYFFFVALGSILMAADCSNKDSEFYNDVFITIPNLVRIETQSNYVVNDIVWLNSDDFSRYLNEPSQSTPLDAYKTTNGATSFNFTFMLEKQVDADNWQLVTLGDNLIREKGYIEETDLFIAAASVYNPATEHYEFRNGLRITQPGVYRISYGYNSVSTTNVELRSESLNHNLFLNINSPSNDLDGGGNYIFTVAE